MTSILRPQATNPQERLYAKIRALEERVAALERNPAAVPIFSGTPSSGDGTDGSLGGTSTPRLWMKVNGSWHYVALT